MRDQLKFEILEDGRVKVTGGSFSQAVHLNADRLVSSVNELLGGETDVVKLAHSHHHDHDHAHDHEHEH